MKSSQHHQQKMLDEATRWFREILAQNHIRNTTKLANPEEFNINPFLVTYLAHFLTGNASAESIARALIYPRVLGQSITTSFGQNLQKFTSDVLGSYGSTTAGIDIEFEDHLEGRKKYCQLKAGPNTINKDDVETIHRHFHAIRNLARTNSLKIGLNDLVVGVLYGEIDELSQHYKNISAIHHYPVLIGVDFWHRLTGNEDFYFALIRAFTKVAKEANSEALLEETIKKLAATDRVQKLAQL